MKKINVTPHKPINQSQLKKMLNLPSYVIRHLKETNQLKFHRVGTEDIFDEDSVNLFMDTFNRDDYLTVGKCKKILVRCGYYTYRHPQMKFYYFPLNFYVTVKTLIVGNSDIPKEYRLHPTVFGKTQYIRRDEFKKTLNWMRDINNKLHPKKSNTTIFTPPKKKTKVKGLKGTKKIRTKKQSTPHPSVIPSMVCPLSPLTQ